MFRLQQRPQLLRQLRAWSGARTSSLSSSASSGGDLGWFGPGQMVKPFEDAVSKMSVGSLSDVVTTQFGCHIIKKTGQK